MYFVQFMTDHNQKKITALHTHTEALSIICDLRLKIDPNPFWKRFDGLFAFAGVHEEYRRDPDKDEKWEYYAKRLKDVYQRLDELTSVHLVNRMETQIELLKRKWASMDPLTSAINEQKNVPLALFYSYSHRDEGLRDQLQSHLSLLKRNGVIAEWHDRRIFGG